MSDDAVKELKTLKLRQKIIGDAEVKAKEIMDKAREEAEKAYQKIVDEASDRKDAYVEKARLEAGEAIKPIGVEADKKNC